MGSPADAPERRRTLRNAALGALLVLALGLALADRFALHGTPSEPTPPHPVGHSLAVLPFANGSDKALEYYAGGIAEELIAAFARIHELKAIGRASAAHFKDSHDESQATGSKLGVSYLLEGSVNRSATRVQLAAKLISASDGSIVWSEEYDRPLDQIFAIETDIVRSVATKLQVAAPAADSRTPYQPPGGNPAAHDAFLQGKFFAHQTGDANHRKAIDAYAQSVQLDPSYARAYASLAAEWERIGADNLTGAAMADAFAKSDAFANKALELDPTLASPHLVLGTLQFDASHLSAAEVEYRRAAELAPGEAAALRSLAELVASEGRLNEAVDLAHEALTLDPLSSGMYDFLSQILLPLHRYEEAEQSIRKALELRPESSLGAAQLAEVQFLRGQRDAALQTAQKISDAFWRSYALALLHALGDDHAKADAALRELIDKHAENGAFQIAEVYAARKQPDEAFAWLDRAFAAHDTGIPLLLYSPFLLVYRSDPRFVAFCKKASLPVPS